MDLENKDELNTEVAEETTQVETEAAAPAQSAKQNESS